jgi:hypothetical protein
MIESITKNILRVGRFTSSKIAVLTTENKAKDGFGATALKYIKQKQLERKLGRSISLEKYSRTTAWGHLMEQYVCQHKLDTGYESVGDITIQHPTIETWAGTPDVKNKREKVAGSIKCFEPENFANFVDTLTKAFEEKNTEYLKGEYPDEYWQAVSDAIILGMEFMEFIVFMPYQSELPTIRAFAAEYEGVDQWKYRFIETADEAELPYVIDGGHYKNLNIFRFEVPPADKEFLTSKVIAASKLLQPFS